MGIPQGRPKTGGRKAGVPNKKTQDLMEKCEAQGFDPFQAMINIAIHSNDPNFKFSALKEICQYIYPKRKALEMSTNPEMGFEIVIKDYVSKDK